ncbi:MAG TPA: glycosyltransferase family 2 protein [Myxococcales bacterium]|nr:glycosyltransferase family 2 protein [Myxococcales bacterium]
MTAVSSLFVSVVCRLRDERELVEPLLEDLTRVLKPHYENWEIVLVDDGSRDGTTARVKELLGRYEGVRLLRLSRAFGLDIAITAGLESAIGDVVVTLSAETDPPELIPQLVELARNDNAAVYGIAPSRRRGLLRECGARAFYRICRLLDLPIQRHSTQLRALPRQAVNAIVEIKDRHRYLRALTPYIGYETRTVEYQPISRSGHPPRESLLEAADTALAVIVGNSTRPLRLVGWLALLAAFLNVVYIGYVFAIRIFKTRVAEGWMTLSLQNAGMFLLLFLILAVVTEYVGRILDETRERPLYYIAEEANSSVMVPSAERRNVVRESR